MSKFQSDLIYLFICIWQCFGAREGGGVTLCISRQPHEGFNPQLHGGYCGFIISFKKLDL
jgi:hypothetical protein